MTTFLDQTTDLAPLRPELDIEAPAADLVSLELETAGDRPTSWASTAVDGARAPADGLPIAAAAATPVPATAAKSIPTSDEPAEPAEHDDLLDIEDSTRLYLREIARVPLLTAEEEVMLAKTMELGKRIGSDPASAVLDLHVWGINDSEPKARTTHPAVRSRLRRGVGPDRPGGARRRTRRWTSWSPPRGSA